MEKKSPWKPDSRSVDQKISYVLLNTKFVAVFKKEKAQLVPNL
jgi:hypothetical protein